MTDKRTTADWPLWWALMCDAHATPCDAVRLYKPDATDEECDHLLWEESCFPVAPVSDWLPQVAAAVRS